MYGCNGPDLYDESQERLPQEAELQSVALAGIRDIVGRVAPAVAREVMVSAVERGGDGLDRVSPLVIGLLYDATTQCRWFVKEGVGGDMEGAQGVITAALEAMGRRWTVAGEIR